MVASQDFVTRNDEYIFRKCIFFEFQKASFLSKMSTEKMDIKLFDKEE